MIHTPVTHTYGSILRFIYASTYLYINVYKHYLRGLKRVPVHYYIYEPKMENKNQELKIKNVKYFGLEIKSRVLQLKIKNEK